LYFLRDIVEMHLTGVKRLSENEITDFWNWGGGISEVWVGEFTPKGAGPAWKKPALISHTHQLKSIILLDSVPMARDVSGSLSNLTAARVAIEASHTTPKVYEFNGGVYSGLCLAGWSVLFVEGVLVRCWLSPVGQYQVIYGRTRVRRKECRTHTPRRPRRTDVAACETRPYCDAAGTRRGCHSTGVASTGVYPRGL